MARPAPPASSSAHAAASPEVWQSTRAETALATQFLGDRQDYLAPGQQEIGRQTSANVRELFVSCAPDLALQQQFEHLQTEFIAVHDIGTHSSRKLLAGLAAAGSRPVQQLLIRRQGYGTTLATLEFVELPGADGSSLRIYSTEADADTAARQGLARVLLGFSRLGVVMVGDLPGHAMAAALRPFQDAMIAGPWPNRHLLLLPLVSGNALASHGAEVARHTRVDVRTSPAVNRPSDAWEFIQGSWGRLGNPDSPAAPAARRPVLDRTAMRPMPVVPTAASRGVQPQGLLARYVQRLGELPGVASCCVFEVASGVELVHAGASPGAADLAMHGKALLGALGASSRALGLGHALPEAAITLGSHHLLLRALPGHPGLALHAALDKASANLTLLRLQIERLDPLLAEKPAG